MADLLAVYGSDPDAEESGVWQEMRGGVRMRIARWGNPAFARRFEELMRPHRRGGDDATLTPDEDRELMATLIAETIVTGWEGVERDGKVLQHSTKACKALLLDPRLHDLRTEIARLAQRAEHYRLQAVEADAKN